MQLLRQADGDRQAGDPTVSNSIRIQRCNGVDKRRVIPLEEWIAAIENTDGVRALSRDVEYASSLTGKRITLKSQKKEAEIYDPQKKSWTPGFIWSRGVVVLLAATNLPDAHSVIKQKATELATKLNADLVGDVEELHG